jgi:hypothetical protein
MPAKNPRINVVVDNAIYEKICLLAEKENVSLSTKVRELIRDALEIQEDILLANFGEKRESTWEDEKAISHEELWS